MPITTSAEDLGPGLESSSGGQSAMVLRCDPQQTDPYITLLYVPGLSALETSQSPYWQAGVYGTYGFEYILWGCNMQVISGQLVRLSLFLPDGTSEVYEFALHEDVALSRWISLPDEPLGQYRWYFETSIGSAELSFYINSPPAPLIRAICNNLYPIGIDVMLTGFQPNEEVEVQHYGGSLPLADEYLNTYYILVTSSGVGYANLGLNEGDYIVAIGANRMISTNLGGSQTMVSGYDRLSCLPD